MRSSTPYKVPAALMVLTAVALTVTHTTALGTFDLALRRFAVVMATGWIAGTVLAF
ncbi:MULTISPECIES: hypothetical protein [unclassified Streptomyces]|uniref:hypothetical protein n=1 Tax=unclassified Streptomyces TaxID=2593676 RepID=UPI0037BB1C0C